MRWERLGERALLLDGFGPDRAASLAKAIRLARAPNVVDAVASFDKVAVYFGEEPSDPGEIIEWAENLPPPTSQAPKRHVIPTCYDLGEDLADVASRLHRSVEEVAQLHAACEYRCLAVGFSFGFAYLGPLAEPLASVGRMNQPRARVEPGSVAIAAGMTAVYPEATPGGWWIIGRTPVRVANLRRLWCAIEPGDIVRFAPIEPDEFEKLKGRDL